MAFLGVLWVRETSHKGRGSCAPPMSHSLALQWAECATSWKVAVTRAVPSAHLPWGEEGACPPLYQLSLPGLGWVTAAHNQDSALVPCRGSPSRRLGSLGCDTPCQSLRSRRPGPPAVQGPSATHRSTHHEQPLKCLPAAIRASLCILGPCSPHGKRCQEQCLKDLLNSQLARVVSPNPENPSVPGPGKHAEWTFSTKPAPEPREERGALVGGGLLLAWGVPSLRYKTHIKGLSASLQKATLRPTQSQPHPVTMAGARLLLALPQGARVTWPGPPAGGAPWRWRPCRTTRAAHAAVESSWGRRCG